jgi:putative transposase
MSRPLRLEFAGALYHVTSRGDGREDIFLGDEDRIAWLDVWGAACKRFNWVCHAYCLMTNHYHLLIETPEGNLSAGMRHLNGVYTQRFNRAHARVGHVFQGRYKAILIDRDSYLLEVARYIVLNPLRAGMVCNIGDWPWSSYGAMLDDALVVEWLDVCGLLAMFGRNLVEARGRYIDFVRAGVGLPSIWNKLQAQVFLGDEAFVKRMLSAEQAGSSLIEVPRAQRRPIAKPLMEYCRANGTKKERNAAILAAWQTGDFTMQAIGDAFGIHYATVSRVVNGAADD